MLYLEFFTVTSRDTAERSFKHTVATNCTLSLVVHFVKASQNLEVSMMSALLRRNSSVGKLRLLSRSE